MNFAGGSGGRGFMANVSAYLSCADSVPRGWRLGEPTETSHCSELIAWKLKSETGEVVHRFFGASSLAPSHDVPRGTIWKQRPKWELFHVEHRQSFPDAVEFQFGKVVQRAIKSPRNLGSFPLIHYFQHPLAANKVTLTKPFRLIGLLAIR